MFHRFAHQANTHVKPGMTMNRWGFHFDRTQTWWENAGADWFKYIARGSYMLRQGNPVSDLLVFVGDGSPNSVYLRKDFESEIPAGTNFDCVNADVLLNRIQLKNNKLILPEGTEYKMLVLKNCETLSLETLKRIHEIAKSGVPIVGDKPQKPLGYLLSDEDKTTFSKLVDEIWSQPKTYSTFNWNGIFEKEGILPDCAISNGDDINFMHRKMDGVDIYFLYNPDSLAQRLECTFRVKDKIPELWNPMTGKARKSGQFENAGEITKAWINLEAEESVFVVFCEFSKGAPAISDSNKLEKGEYFLTKDNQLFTEISSGNPIAKIEGSWEVEFLKEHDYAGKHNFENLSDWKDHADENIKYYSGTAVYRTSFDWDKDLLNPENIYTLDLGDVKIVAEVRLNGKELGVSWMPPFHVDITKALKTGENQLEIKITNQWSNKLIGDERFPTSYEPFELEGNYPKNTMQDWYVNNEPLPAGKRSTFCTASFYNADDELMPSGLLGSVQIITKKQTPVTGNN
jgi:hypothetical protein